MLIQSILPSILSLMGSEAPEIGGATVEVLETAIILRWLVLRVISDACTVIYSDLQLCPYCLLLLLHHS